MWHTTWNRMLTDRARLTLTVTAVALGVTVLTAALVLATSTRETLQHSYAQVYAGVDVVVRPPDLGSSGGDGARIPLDALHSARALPGVASVEGRRSTVAQLEFGDGATEPALATSVPANVDRAGLRVRSGELPADADEVAIDAAVARRLGVELGDRVRVLLPDREVRVTVVGTVGFGPLDALAGGARILFDSDNASDVIGRAPFDELHVLVRSGTTVEQVKSGLDNALDPSLVVLSGDEAAAMAAEVAADGTRAVSLVVLAVASIALLVGAFVIANTLRMLGSQRRRELALLRAIGATRAQVAASVMVEGAVTGAVGAIAGTAAGVLAGVVLTHAAGGLMPGLPPLAVSFSPHVLLIGTVVGISLAVLAARGAVRSALSLAPVAAMRETGDEVAGRSRLRLVAGTAAVLLGAVGVATGGSTGTLAVAGGAALALMGTGLLFPYVTGPALAGLSRPFARSTVSELARQQALSAPRRTGSTAAALTVAVALVTFLLTFGSSLAAASPQFVVERQAAEITLRPTVRQGLHDMLFPITERIGALPEVASAHIVTYVQLEMSAAAGAGGLDAYAVDPSAVTSLFDVAPVRGQIAGVTEGDIAVRDDIAEQRGWRIGDALPVVLPDGTRTSLTVAATFRGSVTTNAIVAPATVAAHLGSAYRQAFVDLVPGADEGHALVAVEAAVGEAPVEVLDRAALAAELADANGGFFRLLAAALSLAVVVGLLGVVNTLTLAVLERSRELGVLRAIGASRGQVRATVRWESLFVSSLGATVGGALGLAVGWIATRAIPDLALPYSVPVLPVLLTIAITVLVGVAGASLPARRAARTDILRALQAN